jgi:hypothetical protein
LANPPQLSLLRIEPIPCGFAIRYNLWYPRFKRTTPTLPEFGGNSLSGYNTERGAFRKDMLMPEILK